MIIQQPSFINLSRDDRKPNFKKLQRLVIHQDGYIRFINFDQIEYIKADSNYCNLYLVGGKKILVAKTLKSIGASLDNSFIRTHKSYIISLRHIDAYVAKDSLIHMSSGASVTVSRSHKSSIKNILSHQS